MNEVNPKVVEEVVLTKGKLQFIDDWLIHHQSAFEECMEKIKDELPLKYCEFYIKTVNTSILANKIIYDMNKKNSGSKDNIDILNRLSARQINAEKTGYAEFEDIQQKEERDSNKDFRII